MEKMMYAGFHCVEVQPPLGLRIPGYYNKRLAEGTAAPLHLRATAFSCADEKAVMFNCEAIGMSAAAFEIIKKKVAAACGISEDAVYINCIHSHTSYIIVPNDTEMDDMDVHLCAVYQQFADCAKLAFGDLKPCTISTAIGEAKNIAFVRRYRMKDGTVRTNPPQGDPNVAGPIGTPDEHIRLIRIHRENAKEILIVHFGTHADMIGGNFYTPDWPGYLVNILDAALEGNVHTMFLLGAEGDCATRNAMIKEPRVKGVALSKSFARKVAGAALRAYDSAKPIACDTLRFACKYVQVGKNDYDPADLPMVEEIVKIYRSKGSSAPELQAFPMRYQEALRIKANLARPEFFDLRISGLRLGDIVFVGIPGEPFASIGIDIAEKSNMPMTVVTACTNGYEGYYPDEQAFKEPGYSYEKAVSPFAPNCATVLIEGALSVIEQLQA